MPMFDKGTSPTAIGKIASSWSPDGKLVVGELRDRGAIQGFLTLKFMNPIDAQTQNQILTELNLFTLPLGLYLAFQNRIANNGIPKEGSQIEVMANHNHGPVRLTQRQLQILRGMVEGKTNHDLATELGFSVSTIRHETMRIYQALAVSDRREAAQRALEYGWV